MSENANDDILLPPEAARYLRVAERTILKWARRGEVPAMKIGKVWRFSRRALEDHVAKGNKEMRDAD